jgi:hypothetical protein
MRVVAGAVCTLLVTLLTTSAPLPRAGAEPRPRLEPVRVEPVYAAYERHPARSHVPVAEPITMLAAGLALAAAAALNRRRPRR